MPKASGAERGWLRDALGQARARPPMPSPEDSEWPSWPEPGEFRVATPMDRSPGERARMVLLFEVELGDDPWVNAFLVGDTVDVAAAADVRLEPEETGLPFPALVETDVPGPLFLVQLGPPLGRVEPELLDRLMRVASGEADPYLDPRRGLPLFDRRDARWAWKDRELAEMHALAYPCMAAALRSPAGGSVLVDPEVMSWVERAPGEVEAVRRLVSVLSSAGGRGPGELEAVFATTSGARSFRQRLQALGPDAWRAIEPALTKGLGHSRAGMAAARWRPDWPTAGWRALERRIAAEAAARGARSFRVVTRGQRTPNGVQAAAGVVRDHSPGGAGMASPRIHALEVEGIGLVQVRAEAIVGEDAA